MSDIQYNLLTFTISIASKTMIAPLERVKLILQNQDTNLNYVKGNTLYKGLFSTIGRLTKEEGISSLFRGNVANIFRYSCQQSMNFYFNKKFQAMRFTRMEDLNFFLAGGLAGSLTTFFLYPLDFVRTRIGADSHQDITKRQFKNYRDCIRKVYHNDGIRGFYRGLMLGATFYFFYRAVYFGPFEVLKKHVKAFKENFKVKWLLTQLYMMSFQIVFYPFDTIRRRLMMQSGRTNHQMDYDGVFDCTSKIY